MQGVSVRLSNARMLTLMLLPLEQMRCSRTYVYVYARKCACELYVYIRSRWLIMIMTLNIHLILQYMLAL
jgi:hypothetical protein